MRKTWIHCGCRFGSACSGLSGAGQRGRGPLDDRSAGRLLGAAGRPAQGHLGEGGPGSQVQSLPGAGIANVRGIEEGKAEVGFANTITTADAVAGTGEAPLDKKHDKVCNVATLYPQYFQIVVQCRQRHQHDQGREGQRLRHAGQGQHRRADCAPCARVSGMTYSDVKASFTNSYTDSVEQMKDNRMHMFALGTGIPASSLMDLASARDIKLLDMSAHLRGHAQDQPGLQAGDDPEGHLSQAGQGRAGDRLLHARHRRLLRCRRTRSTR